jgi:hypothetical protein
MLRKRPDDTFEFLLVEEVFTRASFDWPPGRREAVRLRIFSALGSQEHGEPYLGLRARERWIAIPAGIGAAAAVIFAMQFADSPDAGSGSSLTSESASSVTFESLPADQAFVSAKSMWVQTLSGAVLGLEANTTVVRTEDTLAFVSGKLTVMTGAIELSVVGDGWTAQVAKDSIAEFNSSSQGPTVQVLNGSVVISGVGEPRHANPSAGVVVLSPHSEGASSAKGAAGLPAAAGTATPGESGQEHRPTGTGSDANPPIDPGQASPPTDPGNAHPPGDAGQANPPVDPGNTHPPADPGQANPPSEPGKANPPSEPGNAHPPSDPGNAHPPAEPGQANPPTDPGNGHPPADPGKADPPSDPGNDHSSANPGRG